MDDINSFSFSEQSSKSIEAESSKIFEFGSMETKTEFDKMKLLS